MSNNLSRLWAGLSWIAALFLSGCGGSSAIQPTMSPAVPPLPVATPTPAESIDPQLEAYFQGFTGAFVLYDQARDRYIRYNPQRCGQGFLPASTFKIPNSLIGLETGVIPDENFIIPWDGTRYYVDSWNQDHSMKTAIQNSVVWYYVELARRVGDEKMQQYLDAIPYGNRDISTSAGPFWLEGDLRISADEQVTFLRRLTAGDLPFSERSIRIVKELIVLEETDTYRLSGKTGYTVKDGVSIGWFVGYVEKQGAVYYFALNIEDTADQATGVKAKEIALSILQSMGLVE